MSNIDINCLIRDNLSRLINIYACNAVRYKYFQVGFCQKMNINLEPLKCGSDDSHKITNKYVNSKNIYLDTLKYKSIYEKELDKILDNLPNICISNIYNRYLNYSENNKQNLIDLVYYSNSEFVEVN